ncbi:MAG: hypothetical protein D6732_00155, partial [Methanobacteriota archaeon]
PVEAKEEVDVENKEKPLGFTKDRLYLTSILPGDVVGTYNAKVLNMVDGDVIIWFDEGGMVEFKDHILVKI